MIETNVIETRRYDMSQEKQEEQKEMSNLQQISEIKDAVGALLNKVHELGTQSKEVEQYNERQAEMDVSLCTVIIDDDGYQGPLDITLKELRTSFDYKRLKKPEGNADGWNIRYHETLDTIWADETGKPVSIDGNPAWIFPQSGWSQWMEDGKLHNLKGPAAVNVKTYEERFYIEGKQLPYDQWSLYTRKRDAQVRDYPEKIVMLAIAEKLGVKAKHCAKIMDKVNGKSKKQEEVDEAAKKAVSGLALKIVEDEKGSN